MNAAHLHLMTNHLSLVGLGFAILINLYAILAKREELLKLSCGLFVLAAVAAVPAILTGDGAGEIIRSYPGISNDAIEYHETWGYAFFYALIGIGVINLAALWFAGKKPALLKKMNLVGLILAVLMLLLAYQVGTTGGRIRHPEIEQGAYKPDK
jgi:uncharacterized membrane protein